MSYISLHSITVLETWRKCIRCTECAVWCNTWEY